MCSDYKRLESQVNDVLALLVELTRRQLLAFQADDRTLFVQLDKELENTMGRKERTIGALREHARSHGCVASPFPPEA
jgi:hypothetical protein